MTYFELKWKDDVPRCVWWAALWMAPTEVLLLGVHAWVCSPPIVGKNVLCHQQNIADGMEHGFQNSLIK